MIKIGVTGTIAKLSKDKCEYLLKLINKMS